MISARRDLRCGEVQTEEVTPEANNDLQQVSGRKPAVLRRVLSEVDQQVALPVLAYRKRPLYITDRAVPGTLTESSVNRIKAERSRGDSHGIEGLPAPNMLGAVRDLMNKRHPNRSGIHPIGKLIQRLDAELCAKLRLRSDLIVPYPVEKMVRGNGAVYGPSCGVRLSHEVVEVFHQHGIEIVGGYQVEHKAHLSEKVDFTLQCKGE